MVTDINEWKTEKQKQEILNVFLKDGAILLGPYLVLYVPKDEGILLLRVGETGLRKLFYDDKTRQEERRKPK